MKNKTTWPEIDWSNLDLDCPFTEDLKLIEPLTVGAFLLEVNCNIPEITPEALRAQFNEDLQNRIHDAREIFNSNLSNFIRKAKQTRKN
jgi:hypothetical protein